MEEHKHESSSPQISQMVGPMSVEGLFRLIKEAIPALKNADKLRQRELNQKILDSAKGMTQEELLETSRNLFHNKDTKLAQYLAALLILKRHHIVTVELIDEIRVYQDGYFQKTGTEIIRKDLTELFGQHATRSMQNEVINHARNMTYKDESELDNVTPPTLIPVINGVLDINTMKLLKHSPEYLFRYQIPITYDPAAKCPKIDQFIKDIVPEEDISLVYDAIGLCLYQGHLLEKYFIFLGKGQNGKSQLLKLITHLVGPENCSSIPLKQLTVDRFALAGIYNKLVNIGADIGGGTIDDTSIIKACTGGDAVSAQFKFGQIFQFIPHADHIYSANNPPRFNDDSEGNYRRIETVSFPNSFGNEEDRKLNPNIKEAIPNIYEKLTAPEELSGLFNRALQNLIEIRKKGALSKVSAAVTLRKKYVLISNPVKAFLEECCEEADYIPHEYVKRKGSPIFEAGVGFLTIDQLYPAFREFCKNHKQSPLAKDKMAKDMRKLEDWNLTFDQKDYVGGYGEKFRQRSVRGIKFKPINTEVGSTQNPAGTSGTSGTPFLSIIATKLEKNKLLDIRIRKGVPQTPKITDFIDTKPSIETQVSEKVFQEPPRFDVHHRCLLCNSSPCSEIHGFHYCENCVSRAKSESWQFIRVKSDFTCSDRRIPKGSIILSHTFVASELINKGQAEVVA